MLRILLADDHAMVRKGFRLILETQPDMQIVGEAGNGREAVELAEQLHPDVVVMDVAMPAGLLAEGLHR
jgi:DNA-binding NarL/FixJ family response regulator